MVEDTPLLRALVDALEEPALIVEGLIIGFANQSAKDLFGGKIEGRDVRLAIRHPDVLEHVLGGRPADVDATGIVEPGRTWDVAVRDLGHGTMLVRMRDRSATVAAEKMRVDFVANASHELRTPLSTILGYAETLSEEGEQPEVLRAKFGSTIREEARRMLRIIEDLMSLSRIEADRFLAPEEDVPIADVIESAIASAAHGRNGNPCEFAVEIADDLPPVRGDRAQLEQVLDNLLGNAIRYGCDGPRSKIEIAAQRDNSWIAVTVTDHGRGIPREHLPRLTERFYRVDAARSRESGGTGLGLAIVKHIVERHRGTLEIKSVLGEGTSVTVRLPAAS
jgi:two-component system phosphate regulon sensor histidine kinase PhoR